MVKVGIRIKVFKNILLKETKKIYPL